MYKELDKKRKIFCKTEKFVNSALNLLIYQCLYYNLYIKLIQKIVQKY
jgi:hypothetical protein